jgi:cysteine-rich repeat protein
MRSSSLCAALSIPVLAAALVMPPGLASAHQASFPLSVAKLGIKTRKNGKESFVLKVRGESALRLQGHDPLGDTTSLVVRGTGGKRAGGSGLIQLDRSKWSRVEAGGELVGYRYEDRSGSRGGVTRIVLENGRLEVKARGKNWPWRPAGKHESILVEFRIAEELYCAEVTRRAAKKNKRDFVKANRVRRPGSCREQVCGNGQLQAGEACDDGNLLDDDGCTSQCAAGACTARSFAGTYDAIQSEIFDSPVYGCTNAICHDGDAPAGNLDLTAGASYAALVDRPGSIGGLKLVQVTDPETSLLYLKLAAKTLGTPGNVGTPMPQNQPALSEAHLDAVYRWIRGGAPRDLVVEGTQAALATCLPEPDPLKIDPVPPPPASEGFQLTSTPRFLPRNSESEICYSTFYDLSAIVPESAVVDCPPAYRFAAHCSQDEARGCTQDADCGAGNACVITKNRFNPESKCVAFNHTTLIQDPQSHHSVQFLYAGAAPLDDPAWGPWTYRFDGEDPRTGMPCDPLAVDPAVGTNPGCSSGIFDDVACINYGPPDFEGIGNFLGTGSNPQLLVSQEAYFDYRFHPGVFDVIPIRGLITWNSHAFNLTGKDSTQTSYLNMGYAGAAEQLHPAQAIFDVSSVFAQDVPPYETREYCRTYTAPEGAHIFRLSSHQHRHGTLFRIWPPPNAPCRAGCPESPGVLCAEQFIGGGGGRLPVCDGPRPTEEAIYISTRYSDPVELYFDPPLVMTGTDGARSFLYCGVYDNESAPGSPPVKRRSASPPPNEVFPRIAFGGPCAVDEVSCIADPANPADRRRGKLCGGDDRICDSRPGAGDGECDACPVRGGVTTEDEMFILFGGFYVP